MLPPSSSDEIQASEQHLSKAMAQRLPSPRSQKGAHGDHTIRRLLPSEQRELSSPPDLEKSGDVSHLQPQLHLRSQTVEDILHSRPVRLCPYTCRTGKAFHC